MAIFFFLIDIKQPATNHNSTIPNMPDVSLLTIHIYAAIQNTIEITAILCFFLISPYFLKLLEIKKHIATKDFIFISLPAIFTFLGSILTVFILHKFSFLHEPSQGSSIAESLILFLTEPSFVALLFLLLLIVFTTRIFLGHILITKTFYNIQENFKVSLSLFCCFFYPLLILFTNS